MKALNTVLSIMIVLDVVLSALHLAIGNYGYAIVFAALAVINTYVRDIEVPKQEKS